MTQGIRRGRLAAVDTCLSRNWRPGVCVSSENWSCDREIVAIGRKFVSVRLMVKGGGGGERIRSFPPDVRRVRGKAAYGLP
jgi:hypothetical protein